MFLFCFESEGWSRKENIAVTTGVSQHQGWVRLEDKESLSHGHYSWEGPLTFGFLMTSFGQEQPKALKGQSNLSRDTQLARGVCCRTPHPVLSSLYQCTSQDPTDFLFLSVASAHCWVQAQEAALACSFSRCFLDAASAFPGLRDPPLTAFGGMAATALPIPSLCSLLPLCQSLGVT